MICHRPLIDGHCWSYFETFQSLFDRSFSSSVVNGHKHLFGTICKKKVVPCIVCCRTASRLLLFLALVRVHPRVARSHFPSTFLIQHS